MVTIAYLFAIPAIILFIYAYKKKDEKLKKISYILIAIYAILRFIDAFIKGMS
ncbi:hypothetical protein KAJ27_23940 [bacterium]|nr:hypothetical protein [bacterium]